MFHLCSHNKWHVSAVQAPSGSQSTDLKPSRVSVLEAGASQRYGCESLFARFENQPTCLGGPHRLIPLPHHNYKEELATGTLAVDPVSTIWPRASRSPRMCFFSCAVLV